MNSKYDTFWMISFINIDKMTYLIIFKKNIETMTYLIDYNLDYDIGIHS
jgi:hypothetical protein